MRLIGIVTKPSQTVLPILQTDSYVHISIYDARCVLESCVSVLRQTFVCPAPEVVVSLDWASDVVGCIRRSVNCTETLVCKTLYI